MSRGKRCKISSRSTSKKAHVHIKARNAKSKNVFFNKILKLKGNINKLKPSLKLKVMPNKRVLAFVLCLLIVLSLGSVFAYFSANDGRANYFEIAGANTIVFDSNGGTGTMANQILLPWLSTNLTANSYTRSGFAFAGWNTEADGSGTSYTDQEAVTNLGNITLYAQWQKQAVKYAVQIYGIGQDEDADGNSIGLTFGPATGANYNNSYVTHTYEETSSGSGSYYVKIVTHEVDSSGTETTTEEYLKNSSGNNVTRTTAEKNKYDINMHTMTWAEISAVSDKTAFKDCMLCGDTKSVEVNLNSTIKGDDAPNQYGDGAGMLYSTINSYYRRRNPSQSDNSYVGTGVTLDSNEQSSGSNARNAGGYSSSHIRATLIGKENATAIGGSTTLINEGYAGNVNLSGDTCLYSCIQSDLKSVITPKKINYVTGTGTSSYTQNSDIADSIWLFSEREMYSTASDSGTTAEGIGSSGVGYARFSDTESRYYMSSYSTSSTANRTCYNEAGSTYTWWSRSLLLSDTYGSRTFDSSGKIKGNTTRSGVGLALGFCIKDPSYQIQFNSNGGSGTMANQTVGVGQQKALTANSFVRGGYAFKGWNTKANGTGTSYTDGQSVQDLAGNGETITLYAQWESVDVKYAVQIYGIGQDEDADGNSIGLTFGPATGANYNNSYVTHTYEETSAGSGSYYVKIVTHTVAANGTETTTEEYLTNSSGNNVTRTTAEKNKYDINMHDMTWEQISAVSDKTAFKDCMLCGDTKSIALKLNSTIKETSVSNQYGDGAGMLNNTIKAYYRRWNPNKSENSYVGTDITLDSIETSYGSNARNAGAYSSSHMRATLIGKENAKAIGGSTSLTNESYAGNVNLNGSTSLFSCLPSDLQSVITPKKIKYVTGTGTGTSNYTVNNNIADSIWLFSEREMYSTATYSGTTSEGLGTSGVGYSKFSDTESKYYMSSYNVNSATSRAVYFETGASNYWWLRSDNLSHTSRIRIVYSNGSLNNSYAHNSYGIGIGFCIKDPSYQIQFNRNGGSGTMTNQTVGVGQQRALKLNSYTRNNYTFNGWNTKANGTGTSYTDGQSVQDLAESGETITLYAQWLLTPKMEYSLQIYGINQDVDSSGNTLGLTFGPTMGELTENSSNNISYVTHDYISAGSGNYYVRIVKHKTNGATIEEYLEDSDGNRVTRTTAEKNKYDVNINTMTWAEIAAVSDKTVFRDCMLCGDTKTIELTLNNTITGGGSSIDDYYKKWNPSSSDNSAATNGGTTGSNARNAGGYSSSHIRATLIGRENAKAIGGSTSLINNSYAGNVNLTGDTCLYSCLPSDLRAVITPKKINYVTGTSTSNYTKNSNIADSIWLFSEREVDGTSENTGNTTEGLGSSGEVYSKFSDTESYYYGKMPGGWIRDTWLRSPDLSGTSKAKYDCMTDEDLISSGEWRYGGYISSRNVSNIANELAFGFCIR